MSDKTEKNNRKQVLRNLREVANEQFENSLPMGRDKFKMLIDYLDTELGVVEYDHTNRLTRSFLE